MTVYVDHLTDYKKRIGRCGPFWCHMTADTPDELHAFAERIGLKRTWAQHVGKPTLHYDLTASRRAKAVRLGAVEVTNREGANLLLARMDAAAR